MKKTGVNTNIGVTVRAWSDIVVDRWRDRINSLNIGVTGELYDSLRSEIIGMGENPHMVRFKYKKYGIYVNFGVGGEISRGNTGDLGFTPARRAKRWFSPVIYSESIKLSRILAEKYSIKGANYIIEEI